MGTCCATFSILGRLISPRGKGGSCMVLNRSAAPGLVIAGADSMVRPPRYAGSRRFLCQQLQHQPGPGVQRHDRGLRYCLCPRRRRLNTTWCLGPTATSSSAAALRPQRPGPRVQRHDRGLRHRVRPPRQRRVEDTYVPDLRSRQPRPRTGYRGSCRAGWPSSVRGLHHVAASGASRQRRWGVGGRPSRTNRPVARADLGAGHAGQWMRPRATTSEVSKRATHCRRESGVRLGGS